MDAVEAVLNQYQPYIDKSPKGPDSNNESDTIFPRFDQQTILKICAETMPKIEKVGSFVTLVPPIVYVGDIHGNLTDLLHIFHIFGLPPQTKYLFLGDYVDRGSHSIEVITILMALFCKFPEHICLLRGNHEFSAVNKIYGFYEETLNSYGTEDVWSACNGVFGYMPFAAVVGNQIFCVHGGLSADLTNTNTIKEIDLPVGLYEETELISDLVWSDPVDEINLFEQNKRGCGVLYGPGAITNFLKNTKLKVVLRAHQCVPTGYSFNCNHMCITLFSSSNYCKQLQNKSGVILHNENRELCFYCLKSDSDVGVKPKTVMSIPVGQALGLKPCKPNKALPNANGPSQINKRKSINIPKVPISSAQGSLTPTTKLQAGRFCISSRESIPPDHPANLTIRTRANASSSFLSKRKGSESLAERNKMNRRSTIVTGFRPSLELKQTNNNNEVNKEKASALDPGVQNNNTNRKVSKSMSSEQLTFEDNNSNNNTNSNNNANVNNASIVINTPTTTTNNNATNSKGNNNEEQKKQQTSTSKKNRHITSTIISMKRRSNTLVTNKT